MTSYGRNELNSSMSGIVNLLSLIIIPCRFGGGEHHRGVETGS